MCRNIKPLFNFEPPATDEEIRDASLQFIRKISGFQKPSKANKLEIDRAVDRVTRDAKILLESLITDAAPRNREIEKQKAHERARKRFGNQKV